MQLRDNDIRSYERSDAERIMAGTPGAFIIGEQADATDGAATSDDSGGEKAQRSAPNKARSATEAKDK